MRTASAIVRALLIVVLLGACGGGSDTTRTTSPPPPEERILEKEILVEAPPDVVWDAFTTSEGARTFFAPDALIELREGGPYELYFDVDGEEGSRGSEGCVVVSFEETVRLEFTWNFPPSLPIRNERTRVVVTFQFLPPHSTRVRLTQGGWKSGAAWDKGYAYFDRAWGNVLENLKRRFAEGPIDWAAP